MLCMAALDLRIKVSAISKVDSLSSSALAISNSLNQTSQTLHYNMNDPTEKFRQL